MLVEDLRSRVSPSEWVGWKVYFGRRMQRQQVAQPGPGRRTQTRRGRR